MKAFICSLQSHIYITCLNSKESHFLPISHLNLNKSKGSKMQPVRKGIKCCKNANIKHEARIQQKRWDALDSILPGSVDASSSLPGEPRQCQVVLKIPCSSLVNDLDKGAKRYGSSAGLSYKKKKKKHNHLHSNCREVDSQRYLQKVFSCRIRGVLMEPFHCSQHTITWTS